MESARDENVMVLENPTIWAELRLTWAANAPESLAEGILALTDEQMARYALFYAIAAGSGSLAVATGAVTFTPSGPKLHFPWGQFGWPKDGAPKENKPPEKPTSEDNQPTSTATSTTSSAACDAEATLDANSVRNV